MQQLLKEIRQCRLCEPELPFGANPVVQASPNARILIVGQAPGRLVHETGLPFNDPSGDRLRTWMGVDCDTFYDDSLIALLPMAFCFPGTGKSGDLPPPPRCAESWRRQLLENMTKVKLTIVLGQYAIGWHIPSQSKVGQNEKIVKRTLTDVVKDWQQYWPSMIPLPHPSPRNNLWLKRNPWLEQDLIPALQTRVSEVLAVPK